MSCTASDLIAIAQAEVGYLEKKTNAQLDSKTANTGRNNYTKYARDLHAAGYYQASKQGFAWCDMFVDWCFYMLCGKDAQKAQQMICQSGPYGAGCAYSANYYRNAGRFHTSPKVGDQIFFGTKGKESHTGIVYKVEGSKVYTIEGNTSTASGVVANGGGVCKKSYALSYSKIVGYGRPRYDGQQTGTCKLTLPVLKKGVKGESVKALQHLLTGYGFACDPDGSFGPATLEQLLAFQASCDLGADGSCGPATWAALLGVSP